MRFRGEAFKDGVVKIAGLESRGFAEEKHFKMEALKRSPSAVSHFTQGDL